MILPQNNQPVNKLREVINILLDSDPDPRVRCCKCGQLRRLDFMAGIALNADGNPVMVCGLCDVYGPPEVN